MTAYGSKTSAMKALIKEGFVEGEAEWIRFEGAESESRAILFERDGQWHVEPTRIGSVELNVVIRSD
ncbi:MAG: hypothetical protein P4M05_28395 [Bradyrhizobium sp.]|nr:hypothetical protein [Bradyrhizobium sp.]